MAAKRAAKPAPKDRPAKRGSIAAVLPAPDDRLRVNVNRVALEVLEVDPDNARTHDEANLAAIQASLLRFGQAEPLIVQRSRRRVIGGNGRLEAMRRIGWKEADAVFVDLDDTAARALSLALNRTAEASDAGDVPAARWNVDRLLEQLATMRACHPTLPSTLGFSDDAIARASDRLAALREEHAARGRNPVAEDNGEEDPERDDADEDLEEGEQLEEGAIAPAPRPGEGEPKRTAWQVDHTDANDPEIPEPLPEPVCRTGDLWKLGEHWLLCGDSTDDEDVARLVAKKKLRCVVTDPPYAIYGSSTGIGSDIVDDKMVRPFFLQLCRRIESLLREWDHAYVFCDWRSYAALWNGAAKTSLRVKNAIVWDKGGGGLGSNYANTYELAAYLMRAPPARAMASNEKSGIRSIHRPNIIRCTRVTGADRQHNAAKPIAVLEELVKNSVPEGEWLADLYGGSGSTMIAAGRVNRRCVTMEIEEKYCDVILRRWQTSTGQKAQLAETTSGDGSDVGLFFDDVAHARGKALK